MILNVIFSYNRAIQLDYLIQSVIKRFKSDSKVVILYHTTGAHQQGYDLLKKICRSKSISFVERKNVVFDWAYWDALNSKKTGPFLRKGTYLIKTEITLKELSKNHKKQRL